MTNKQKTAWPTSMAYCTCTCSWSWAIKLKLKSVLWCRRISKILTLPAPTADQMQILLSIYSQLCVVQYGEFGR